MRSPDLNLRADPRTFSADRVKRRALCLRPSDGAALAVELISFTVFEVDSRGADCIINWVKGVKRAVYDVTSKPQGTIEWA